MNGQLRDHPLAELIHEISGAQLSGALRVAHERVRGVVYFDNGRLIAALTNLRASRLIESLRRGGLTQAQFAAHVNERMSDEEACAALVAAGVLASTELGRHHTRRSEESVRLMLQWADGEWSFDPRVRLDSEWGVVLNVSQLLIEAARQLSAETVARGTGGEAATFSPSAAAQDLCGGLRLLPAEGFVLSRVPAQVSMGELLAVSGLPEPEARRAVYALTLGGLLVRENSPGAFSAEELARARRAGEATQKAASKRNAATESGAQATAATSDEKQSPAAAEQKAEPDARSEIEELFARTGGSSHYEMLGVTRNVKADEIKRAYYALAKRFHPDRFRSEVDDSQRQRVESAFSKIAQAYDVLKDSTTRAGYDLKLEKSNARPSKSQTNDRAGESDDKGQASAGTGAAVDESSSAASASTSSVLYRAEERFQQGLSALQKNDTAQAKRCFGEAALLMPRQPRYRAYYGRALSREKQTRRQAEAELQAAVALDQGNAAYRVMLAELYRDLGLRRRAEGELQRALTLEPGNAAARRMLDEMRGAG